MIAILSMIMVMVMQAARSADRN
eukprot:COSAG06_NODE_21384_length_758_cov_6688.370258_2_plen_22_part_01